MSEAPYIGRFAPSPTGPLHFGSLVAAVGSYLQARRAQGRWLVRIEDIDTPRVVPGTDRHILRTLEHFGFEWDGKVRYQSQCLAQYEAALSQLHARDLVYPCSCTRSEVAAIDEQRYPGTCRNGVSRLGVPVALRFRAPAGTVAIDDLVQGKFTQNVAASSGDFVVKRRDGLFAYHLAVVVDDADQGVIEVVRGADLLDSTPRHRLLQAALGVPTPRYCHLPLAVNASGQKLSKSAQSIAVDAANAPAILWDALQFLRQSPPGALKGAALPDVWAWAIAHWNLLPLSQVKLDRAPPP